MPCNLNSICNKKRSVATKKGYACIVENKVIKLMVVLKNIVTLCKHEARIWGAGQKGEKRRSS